MKYFFKIWKSFIRFALLSLYNSLKKKKLLIESASVNFTKLILEMQLKIEFLNK